ncbi:MAG TPA: hypothetical protein DDW50_20545 [Firmicutes bacterium]|nr:hypothetical protein [Bacillota bacterium]
MGGIYGSHNIKKEGAIVLTTGVACERPQKTWAIAASICGAMTSLAKALAMELAPIRVNAINPGVVRIYHSPQTIYSAALPCI